MSSPTDDNSNGEGGGAEQAPPAWRFSVDENLPRELAARLRAVGYGAEHVIEVGLRGHSDAGVYAYAQAEGATVVTIWAMTLGRLVRRGHCRWMLPMHVE